jgi:hypothetical protein
LTTWPKLSFYGQNVEANFDYDHPQNSKIFMVKMVNDPKLIMKIYTIPDFLLLRFLKFVEFVEISVNFDHLMIKWYYGHGQNGHFDH